MFDILRPVFGFQVNFKLLKISTVGANGMRRIPFFELQVFQKRRDKIFHGSGHKKAAIRINYLMAAKII
jgi:hypothetical protein